MNRLLNRIFLFFLCIFIININNIVINANNVNINSDSGGESKSSVQTSGTSYSPGKSSGLRITVVDENYSKVENYKSIDITTSNLSNLTDNINYYGLDKTNIMNNLENLEEFFNKLNLKNDYSFIKFENFDQFLEDDKKMDLISFISNKNFSNLDKILEEIAKTSTNKIDVLKTEFYEKKYRLLFEPILYFKYNYKYYAFTASEMILFNKKIKDNVFFGTFYDLLTSKLIFSLVLREDAGEYKKVKKERVVMNDYKTIKDYMPKIGISFINASDLPLKNDEYKIIIRILLNNGNILKQEDIKIDKNQNININIDDIDPKYLKEYNYLYSEINNCDEKIRFRNSINLDLEKEKKYNDNFCKNKCIIINHILANKESKTILKKDNVLANVKIQSDEYDVEDKIPVDQKVKIIVNSYNPIILKYKYSKVFGYKTYNFNINRRYKDYDEETKTTTTHIETSFDSIIKDYEYYKIDDIVCYRLKNIDIKNKAISEDSHIILDEKDLIQDKIDVDIKVYTPSEHILEQRYKCGNQDSKTFDIYLNEDEEFNIDDYVSDILTRNDRIIIDNEIIMNDNYSYFSKIPKNNYNFIRDYQKETVLYKNVKNGRYDTIADFNYEKVYEYNINDSLNLNNINGNDVVIFTPVASDFTIFYNDNLDQRSDLDENKINGIKALMMENIIKLKTFSDRDDFLNENLNKNIHKEKMSITFDFNTYLSYDEKNLNNEFIDEKFFVEKNKEFDLEKDEFYIKPVSFNTQGIKNIVLKTYAKNYLSYENPLLENMKNTEDENSISYCIKKIDLTGRIFNFAIVNINDNNYQNLKNKKMVFITGDKDLNGIDIKDNYSQDIKFLPIYKEKNEFLKSPSLGYSFEFNIKTMGDFYHKNDIILLIPKYYYINFDKNEKEEVNVYYRKNQNFIKSGSKNDDFVVNYVFYDNFKKNAIEKTINIYDFLNLYSKNVYSGSDFRNFIFMKKENSFIDLVQIPSTQRLLVGDRLKYKVSKIDENFINASLQSWYGVFELPNSAEFIRKKDDIMENYKNMKDFFIRDGFIVVSFDIKILQNGKIPRLEYNTSTQNTYLTQGYKIKQDSLIFELGDAIVFEINQRASNRHSRSLYKIYN